MTRSILKIIWLVAFVAACNSVGAQEYDLLIKNGHLIDAKNELDQAMDVAILDGKVAVTGILRGIAGFIIGYDLHPALGRWGTGYDPRINAVIRLSLIYGNPV